MQQIWDIRVRKAWILELRSEFGEEIRKSYQELPLLQQIWWCLLVALWVFLWDICRYLCFSLTNEWTIVFLQPLDRVESRALKLQSPRSHSVRWHKSESNQEKELVQIFQYKVVPKSWCTLNARRKTLAQLEIFIALSCWACSWRSSSSSITLGESWESTSSKDFKVANCLS